MAITPEQANNLTAEEHVAAINLEAKIDGMLPNLQMDMNGGRMYELPANYAPKIIQEIICRYNENGWDVRREHGIMTRPMNALYFMPCPQEVQLVAIPAEAQGER